MFTALQYPGMKLEADDFFEWVDINGDVARRCLLCQRCFRRTQYHDHWAEIRAGGNCAAFDIQFHERRGAHLNVRRAGGPNGPPPLNTGGIGSGGASALPSCFRWQSLQCSSRSGICSGCGVTYDRRPVSRCGRIYNSSHVPPLFAEDDNPGADQLVAEEEYDVPLAQACATDDAGAFEQSRACVWRRVSKGDCLTSKHAVSMASSSSGVASASDATDESYEDAYALQEMEDVYSMEDLIAAASSPELSRQVNPHSMLTLQRISRSRRSFCARASDVRHVAHAAVARNHSAPPGWSRLRALANVQHF